MRISTSMLYHGFGIKGYSYVRTQFAHAKIVFGHFHIIKMLNDKFSDFRRELQREDKYC